VPLKLFVQTALAWPEVLGELPAGIDLGRHRFAAGARDSRLVLFHTTPPDPDEVGSTTGVHLLQDDGRLEVRIPKFSSPLDTVLALSTIEGASRAAHAPIEWADSTALSHGIDDAVVAQIADEKATAEARLLRRALDEEAVVAVHGYRRPVFIGQYVVSRLAAQHPVDKAAELVLGLIEAVQALDPEQYRLPEPALIPCALAEHRGDAPPTYVACASGARTFLAAADYIALLGAPDPIYVPFARIDELAPGRFEWIDDRQGIFDGFIDDAGWAEVLARGADLAADPAGARRCSG
jgi:hypothetical protein